MMIPTTGEPAGDEAEPDAFTAIIGRQRKIKRKKFFTQDLQILENRGKIQALSIIIIIRDNISKMVNVVKMIFAGCLVAWGVACGRVEAMDGVDEGADVLPGCRLESFLHGVSSDGDEGGDALCGLEAEREGDRVMTVRTTAYTHTEADHVQWANRTATGSTLRYGKVRSAAADWSRYPVGTRFRIVGEPAEYVVEDYGSALVGKDTIDLYKPSRRAMNAWGVRMVEIEIVEWGSVEESLEILEPRVGKSSAVRRMVASLREREGGDEEEREVRG